MWPIIDYEWKIRKVGPSAVTFETKMFLRLTLIQSRNCIGQPITISSQYAAREEVIQRN